MIRLLLYKWFGLPEPKCNTCEVLRDSLEKSEIERKELLGRILQLGEVKPEPPTAQQELRPITPQFVPWRVRQQMLEQEDRKQAELLRNKTKEIEDLEKELGVEQK